jgi:hypothetical protein
MSILNRSLSFTRLLMGLLSRLFRGDLGMRGFFSVGFWLSTCFVCIWGGLQTDQNLCIYVLY